MTIDKKTCGWEAVMRQAIKDSGLSLYALERLSGISDAQLSRFMNRKRTLTLRSAEKIAEHIGVELIMQGVKNGKSNQKHE